MFEVIPCPGNDYKSEEEVLTAWNNDSMFYVMSRNMEISKSRALSFKVPDGKIKLYYNKFQNFVVVDLGSKANLNTAVISD